MSIPCIYISKNIHTWYIQVQTCIYDCFTKSKKCIMSGIEPMTSCILASCLNSCATRVDDMIRRNVVLVNCLPGGWCRTSGAGPAAPPSPAMTSPDRASTRISLKPRSAAKQALAALMWRRTAARLRNSPRLESLPVFVQLTQTKRVTPHWIGGPASGPPVYKRSHNCTYAARAMTGRVKQQAKQVKGGAMGSAAKLAAQRQAAALNKSNP